MTLAIYTCLAILCIVFLQSGIDKVFHFKSEKDFVQSHFRKSPINKMSGALFIILAILEITSGVLSAGGIIHLYLHDNVIMANLASVLSSITLLSLLLGQRVAKDYAGAQTIIIYLVPVILLFITIELYGL
jgi:uncharacterized membrane protein YphA (DoxX/SURF4 family)